jgi:ABC-type uncharacterized transport system ATPase subunit
MEHVWKAFGLLQALRDVSLSAAPGEIHALVGENGAGKTTLMRILAGLEHADGGTVTVGGTQLPERHSAREALAAGVGLVPQHPEVVPGLTVLENLVLGAEPSRLGLLKREEARAKARAIAAKLGFDFDWDLPAQALSFGQRQRLDICRLLWRDLRVLALDEPTTVLGPQEVEGLFGGLRALAREGRTVLFVSHRLEEVCQVADRATVLRGGRVVGRLDREELSPALLARLMVGELPPPLLSTAPRAKGRVALKLEKVSTRALGRGERPLREVDLEVGEGEIVGVAGVDGNGQSELVEVVLGLRRCDGGSVELCGVPAAALSPVERRRLGLAVVPGDRMSAGVDLAAPLWENVSAGLVASGEGCRFGIVRKQPLRQRARQVLAEAGVQGDVNLRTGALSGGNIQRLVLGRELASAPRALVAAHPTRGVDVRGTAFIHAQLRQLSQRGCAVLLISASLDEISQLSDRVYVLHAGRVVGTFVPGQISGEAVGLMMSGAQVPAQATLVAGAEK